MTDFRKFTVEERVRWGDVDAARIIFYGSYIRFFEIAETELFRAAGFKQVGVHRRHGLLDGRWRDVVVVELLLPLAEKDFTDSSAPA